MFVQLKDARSEIEAATRVVSPAMACVRIGDYRTAQGQLVWERGDIACVRVFSKTFIGKRI